ncbi:MAG TPA: outer membrane lipoprotein-sorting protein [Sneathiellales bacterium]|nr:outer membrane lipoprotein-sorting protein [Sneathiellales bacterium]
MHILKFDKQYTRPHFMASAGKSVVGAGMLSAAFIFAMVAMVSIAHGAEKTWRTVDQLTPAELKIIDLSPVPQRIPEQSYLPEEPYPFSAPYTAEEVGYRLLNFTHLARWSHVLADVFGNVTKYGYLTQSTMSGMINHIGAPGPKSQIEGEPGEVYSNQLYYYTSPPKLDGQQQMWNLRRSGPEHATKLDLFAYSPELRRVRRQPPPRRDAQFPNSVLSFDDVTGREAWEFSWRFIGADIIYETVRFPDTRPTMTLTRTDGSFYEKATAEFKMMGDEYPYYRSDGGIDCIVVVAEPRRDWLPDYKIDKLIYWVDRHYFYPLRLEQYNEDGNLETIQVQFAQQENPELPGGEGYTDNQAVYLDLELDLIGFSIHDSHAIVEWSEDEKALFTPDFMRRRWLTRPRKSLALVDSPDQVNLRPHIYEGRFPKERKFQIPPDMAARIKAQDAAGHLVFN